MLAPLEQPNGTDAISETVIRVWDACDPAPAAHPYLARYDLPPSTLRIWKGALIALLRDSDAAVGLLIVDAAGTIQSWLPGAASAHFCIGIPGDTAIIAVTTFADVLALHELTGHQVFLASSPEAALELKDRMAKACGSGRRILIAGLSMAEASSFVEHDGWSEDFVVLPIGRSWADLRLQLGPDARAWIVDPVLIFPGVEPARSIWLRRSGLWTSDEEGRLVRLCGPVVPTAVVRSETGSDWSRLIWLIDRDGREQYLSISETDLLMNWRRVIATLVNVGLEVLATAAIKAIVEHLRLATVTMRIRLVERGGWHGHHYLTQVGTVGAPSEDMPMQASALFRAPDSNEAELGLWHEQIARIAQENSRLVIALCAAFAGLCIGLLDDQGGFGIHINGSSSTGKTTALAVAASIHGPASREICSWRSTENGIEAIASKHNNRLLILDELAQIDPRAAAQIGYTLGNGRGKQRANGAGRQATAAVWQLVFLSSGEISLEEKIAEWAGAPAMREGQAVRVMDLPADAGRGHGLFDQLHDFADGSALSDHLKTVASRSTGHVSIAFIERLAVDTDWARHRLSGVRASFAAANLPAEADSVARRAYSNFALLAAAGELAIELKVLPWPPGHAVEQVARCASDWIKARTQCQTPDPLSQAREWLHINAENFMPWEGAVAAAESEFGYLRKEPMGFLLRPKAWQSLREFGGNIPRALKEAGLVRNDPARRPGGKLIRVHILDGRILDGSPDDL